MGGTHGDMSRAVTGGTDGFLANGATAWGTFTSVRMPAALVSQTSGTYTTTRAEIDSGRVTPVGAANKPRAWGALACVYLGAPK